MELIAVCILSLAAVMLTAFLAWSCSRIGSGVWLKAVCHDLEPGMVTLTFDDGPDPVSTPRILDVLAENDLKAYFFVVGEKAERHPGLVMRMVAEGHHVGNHTYTHSALFPLAGRPCIEDEIRACDSVIDSALDDAGYSSLDMAGEPAVPCVASAKMRERIFRPPFGVTNPDIARVLKYTGHKVIGWDVRSLDTCIVKDSLSGAEVSGAVSRCVLRIMSKVRPGSVILLHDRLIHSPELLRALVEALRAEGLIRPLQ